MSTMLTYIAKIVTAGKNKPTEYDSFSWFLRNFISDGATIDEWRIPMAGPSFDNMEGKIWYNGEMVDWTEAQVHVLTHGLHYGSSVFEGARAYSGEIFKLREHNERLIRSGQILGFDIPYTVEELDDACNLCIETNGFENAYVRPVAWRGSEMMGVSAQTNRINVAIATWEWPAYFDPELLEKGIKLEMAKWKRPSPETIPCEAKAAGLYMICTLSKHAAEANGCQDALMLDYRGQLAECTGANIFLIQDGVIHTPTPDCFLDGITRRTIIDLAARRQMKVVERPMFPEDLGKSQEMFIVGTAAEVTPIGSVDEHQFIPGEITRVLREDYINLVNGRELAVAAE